MTARARASGEEKQLKASRKALFRRAAFLFFAGIFLLGIGWSADILHYYAVFIALSALLLQSSNKRLLARVVGWPEGVAETKRSKSSLACDFRKYCAID